MGLKDILEGNTHSNQHIGTAVMPHLLDDDIYRATIENEFNSVVVEHHQKWAPMCEREGLYDFSGADKIVDWAKSKGMNVKGHTLVWHVTSPEWLNNKTSYEISEALRRHIYTTVGHFRDRVNSWDVVNESLAPNGSLARNIFLEKLGPSYIEESFKWARMADPNALLIYNDNKVEGFGNGNKDSELYCSNHSHKSDQMFELVKKLKENGVAIDAVGVQAHFNAAGVQEGRVPSPDSVIANIRRYEEIGLQVNISEMDVRVSELPDGIDKTKAQTDIYRDILKACYLQKNFQGVTFWGFTDKHTWVTDFYYEDSPLLWDTQYKKKPAYFAVDEAIKEAVELRKANGKDVKKSDFDFSSWKSWMLPEPAPSSAPSNLDGVSKPDWMLS